MSSVILAIDPDRILRDVLERLVAGTDVTVESVDDTLKAKRQLIQDAPNLVLSFVGIGSDEKAGITFCRELMGHASLSKVPVMLFSSSINAALTSEVQSAGAKGLLDWPLSIELMRKKFVPYAPNLEESATPAPAAKKPVAPAAATPKAAPTTGGTQPRAQASSPQPAAAQGSGAADPDLNKKLTQAQQLLAKVLHNLKTSDLLGVVEEGDVPRVVYEMTRTVCGITEATPPPPPKKTPEVDIDLDSAFGLKK